MERISPVDWVFPLERFLNLSQPGRVWDDLTDGDHETVYAAWQALPQRSRDAVGVDFQNVAGLATKQGVQIIIEEGRFQRVDLVPELTNLPSHSEKAFHVLLNHPRVFRVARQFNYADNLTRYWHPRNDLSAQGSSGKPCEHTICLEGRSR